MGRRNSKEIRRGAVNRPAKAPRYCHGYKDCRGQWRWYLRRKGYPRAPLPGLPWSPEFMAAYQEALEGKTKEKNKGVIKGSFSELCDRYYKSPYWKYSIADSTRYSYRRIIENIRSDFGDLPVSKIKKKNVLRLMKAKEDAPSMANRIRKVLRKLFKFAVDEEMIDSNPVIEIERMEQPKTGGFKTWDEDAIAKYEAHHPIGSRARLAMALMLYTAQRRSEAVAMGPGQIRNGVITFRQVKTGTECVIPIHSDLRQIIDATPSGHKTFLVTKWGKSFTANGFGNLFRDYIDEAGLPKNLSSHGLRKAACCRLAEAGCTAPEIMSISGHKSISEVQRYIEEANRKRLAVRAMATLEGTKGR